MAKKFITYNGTIVGDSGLTLLSVETSEPTPNPFTNTLSTTFDGVDDYVDLATSTNLNFSGSFTLMAWIKTDAIGSHQMIIDTSTSVTTGNGYSMYLQTSGKIRFWSYHTAGLVDSTTVLSASTWYHVACVHDTVSGTNKIYIDGILENTSVYIFANTSNTTNLRIGNSSVLAGAFDGMIEEVAFFGTDESTNINAIGSTTPTDLTTYSPTTWYRMGDGDTYPTITDNGSGGNDGTMTNMTSANFVNDVPEFNTKSIALDGIDDYVDMNTTLVGTTFSISAWFKVANTTDLQPIVSTRENGISSSKGIDIYIQSDTLTFRIYRNGGTSVTQSFTDLGWNHVLYVYDGTTLEGFLNGVSIGSAVGTYATGTQTLKSGVFMNSHYAETNIDEVALFYTDESANASTIYNGGVPNDLSSFNPLSWWRCGDNDTAPTLTDNGSGGNDGTMTNFTTFSTDVPT